MAKRAKAAKKTAAAKKPDPSSAANGGTGSKARPSEVLAAIPQGKLLKLLKAAKDTTKDVGTLTGTMREKIGYAKEHDNLHTGAFAIIRRLDRLEASPLNIFLAHLDHMLDASGLRERAATAPSLGFGPGAQKNEGEDDDAEDGKAAGEPKPGAATNVRPFPQQAGVAAE